MSTNFMIQSLGPISRYPFTNSLIDGCCGTQLCYAISQSSLHIPLFDVRTNPVPTVTFHRVGPLCFRMFHKADPPNPVSRQARLVLPNQLVKRTYSHLLDLHSSYIGILAGSSVNRHDRRNLYYFT